MTDIRASHVRELRNATGAGMMDCKQALLETKGDMDEATDWLRKKGTQLADKKAGRDADQGLVGVHVRQDDVGGVHAAIVQVNCETDFVAKNEVFQQFVSSCAKRLTMTTAYDDLKSEVPELVAKVGENIKMQEFPEQITTGVGGIVSSYVHNKVADDLGTIGVLVTMVGNGTPTVAQHDIGVDIAMHIAATNPQAVDEDSLDAEWLAHERKIFAEQAAESGKPEAIIEKMVDGKMKKVIRENTLVHQPFVKNTERTVADILSENNLKIINFSRFAIGE